MPSTIRSYKAFSKCLADALAAMDALVAKHPAERDLLSIKKQLEALQQWTKDDKAPTQAQKDSLNFGMLASRAVDDLDQELAQQLYNLASYVTYW